MAAVEKRESGEVYLPWYVSWMWVMRGLPVSLAWFVRWAGGVDRAMETWSGHEGFNQETRVEEKS